jgi:hypothetical protein
MIIVILSILPLASIMKLLQLLMEFVDQLLILNNLLVLQKIFVHWEQLVVSQETEFLILGLVQDQEEELMLLVLLLRPDGSIPA